MNTIKQANDKLSKIIGAEDTKALMLEAKKATIEEFSFIINHRIESIGFADGLDNFKEIFSKKLVQDYLDYSPKGKTPLELAIEINEFECFKMTEQTLSFILNYGLVMLRDNKTKKGVNDNEIFIVNYPLDLERLDTATEVQTDIIEAELWNTFLTYEDTYYLLEAYQELNYHFLNMFLTKEYFKNKPKVAA